MVGRPLYSFVIAHRNHSGSRKKYNKVSAIVFHLGNEGCKLFSLP